MNWNKTVTRRLFSRLMCLSKLTWNWNPESFWFILTLKIMTFLCFRVLNEKVDVREGKKHSTNNWHHSTLASANIWAGKKVRKDPKRAPRRRKKNICPSMCGIFQKESGLRKRQGRGEAETKKLVKGFSRQKRRQSVGRRRRA